MTYNFDPELTPLLELIPPMSIDDPEAAREGFSALIAQMNSGLDETGVRVTNTTCTGADGAPEIPLRIYQPADLTGAVPGLLYLHGGGFVLGDLDSEHGMALNLCRELGIVVVSVDYRLAPETPYPGGLEDCYRALQWTADNSADIGIDTARLGIFGQSAGGGLSAATALLARDRNGPTLCFQYLGIPELDDRLETPSMQRFVDTPMWSRPSAELSWDYYLGDAYNRGGDNVPGYAAPARADDLSGLPPTYVTTMEFDPLRDEGVLYALALMQAGVHTELHCYPRTFHGSTMMPSDVSRRESEDTLGALRRGLNI